MGRACDVQLRARRTCTLSIRAGCLSVLRALILKVIALYYGKDPSMCIASAGSSASRYDHAIAYSILKEPGARPLLLFARGMTLATTASNNKSQHNAYGVLGIRTCVSWSMCVASRRFSSRCMLARAVSPEHGAVCDAKGWTPNAWLKRP